MLLQMKKLFVLLILFVGQSLWAQYNELGVFVGGANVISDVGGATYINPNKWALGILYKRNLHERLSLRADIRHLNLYDNDAKSNISARRQRGFSFTNEMTEIAAGVEYNFLEFNTHKPFDVLFTPYLHTGIIYTSMDSLRFGNLINPNQVALVSENEAASTWAIPVTFGVKTRLGNTRILLGAEIGLRYTFSNNLDGSKPANPNLWFGNLNSNDWYVVSGVYVTFTFGEKPCQCF